MKPLTSNKQLSRITLRGYKSIKECDVQLGALNVLIGSNGAGKSNFIGFFRMIQELLRGKLQQHVSREGGPDALLHFGSKTTERIEVELSFGSNGYRAEWEPTKSNELMFAGEWFLWERTRDRSLGSGHAESNYAKGTGTGIDLYVVPAMKEWRVYHFHDTSESSSMKKLRPINDNAYLKPDAENLAAFLFLLSQKHSESYRRIVHTIQQAAPFFDDFALRPSPMNEDTIELEWKDKNSDTPWKAHALSDGSLRFICLVTVFLQPEQYQPETIIVDEPELGLHPYAISLLGALIRAASKGKQVILSTQSVELINEFDAEDILVVDHIDGQSTFTRRSGEELAVWLEEFSLGELWKTNLIGGTP